MILLEVPLRQPNPIALDLLASAGSLQTYASDQGQTYGDIDGSCNPLTGAIAAPNASLLRS